MRAWRAWCWAAVCSVGPQQTPSGSHTATPRHGDVPTCRGGALRPSSWGVHRVGGTGPDSVREVGRLCACAPRGWRGLQGAGGMEGHSTRRVPGKGEGGTTEGSSEAGPGWPGQLALQVCFLWFPWPRFLPHCGAAETTQAESGRSLCGGGCWDRMSMGASAARRRRPARVRGDKSGEVGRTRVQLL